MGESNPQHGCVSCIPCRQYWKSFCVIVLLINSVSLVGRHSIYLNFIIHNEILKAIGGPRRIQTPNFPNMSRLLCHLSYRSINERSNAYCKYERGITGIPRLQSRIASSAHLFDTIHRWVRNTTTSFSWPFGGFEPPVTILHQAVILPLNYQGILTAAGD